MYSQSNKIATSRSSRYSGTESLIMLCRMLNVLNYIMMICCASILDFSTECISTAKIKCLGPCIDVQGQRNGLFVSNTFGINNSGFSVLYFRLNHCEAHRMFTSKLLDTKEKPFNITFQLLSEKFSPLNLPFFNQGRVIN